MSTVVAAPQRFRAVDRRTVLVGIALSVITVGASLAALALGTITVSPARLLAILTGQGTPAEIRVVLGWRAPRVVAAAVFGAALAVGGAIFQSLTRNPLGSPDIIGFSTGSFTGVLVVLSLGGSGYGAVAGGALAGGLATAVAVYLVAFRGGTTGFRLIVVGIAISAMLASVNTWITVKADIALALQAAVWGAGSIADLRWPTVLPVFGFVGILLVAVRLAVPSLRMLELGDDVAAMLGVRLNVAKPALLTLGVALTASVIAVAGPIGFVALVAPQIARRLTGTGSPGPMTSALVGAALLALSDLLAQHAIPDLPVPVGAVTVSIGGLYLVWLLARETRRR